MNKQFSNFFILSFFFILSYNSLSAQTHNTVPLNDDVYTILEQAQLRGLITPFPNAKPYSRAQVIRALNSILESNTISAKERRIAEETLVRFAPPQKQGYDFMRNAFYAEHIFLSGAKISADVSLKAEEIFSSSFGSDNQWGNEFWFQFFLNGDIGKSFSYGINLEGGIMIEPRRYLGEYRIDYRDETAFPAPPENFMATYSGALTYFPFTYKKRWDGFVWYYDDISNSGQKAWPAEKLSIGYSTRPEMAGEAFEGALTFRAGRFDREWAGMTANNSLVLSQTAQPFLALEGAFQPFEWFSFSTITGILEYYSGSDYDNKSHDDNEADLIYPAGIEQNAFSASMVEFSIPKYLEAHIGSTAIWPKRFELGYLFPLLDNFLYQNNIGDFDNMSLFGGIKVQIPGIFSVWGSFFLDEANPINALKEKRFFESDSQMYSFQAGVQFIIPVLPFTSITTSYTKVEPYCYTHTRQETPWYGDVRVAQAYTNNGAGLGSYLPPNSDEIKVRIESALGARFSAHIQYQMIRHGAEYGSGAVDGSSFYSELKRGSSVDRKFFLRDGAYEWMQILKIGGHFSLAGSLKIPVELFGEAGFVFSQFSNIDSPPANNGSAHDYSFIDTAEYPKTIRGIANIGMRFFW